MVTIPAGVEEAARAFVTADLALRTAVGSDYETWYGFWQAREDAEENWRRILFRVGGSVAFAAATLVAAYADNTEKLERALKGVLSR